jgi:hypothetical protein
MQADRTDGVASGAPDEHEQLTVEGAIASARADSIARAIAEVRMQRERVMAARNAMSDAARDLETSLKIAYTAGATVRELVEPSGLGRTHIHDIVSPHAQRGREGTR